MGTLQFPKPSNFTFQIQSSLDGQRKQKKEKKRKDKAIEVRMLRRRLSVKMEWHPRCPTKNLPVCSRQANELVQEWSMTNAVGCLTGKNHSPQW